MTLSGHSNLADPTDPALCSKCRGPLTYRQKHAYPTIETVLFGASFILFLVFQQTINARPAYLWAWSALQAGLGLFVIRGRVRARMRILDCKRCNPAIR